jgi:hypothetical protein
MDTNPEEFIEGDPKHRWGTLTRGIVDWVVGETDTSSARSLWALEPHELQAITTKYKALYLESQKRAFLKNILGGRESESKKVKVVKRSDPLTSAGITQHALKIMEEEWGKSWSNTAISQNSLISANNPAINVASNALVGYNDARALYANEQTAKVVKEKP